MTSDHGLDALPTLDRPPFPLSVVEARQRLAEVSGTAVFPAGAPFSWLLLPSVHGHLDPMKPVPHEQANGGTPLLMAITHGWFDVAAWLLPVSDLRAQDADGRTALMLAVRNRRPDPAVLDRLLKGSDLLQVDGLGHHALWHTLRTSMMHRRVNVPVLNAVLQHWPLPLDAPDHAGRHALDHAIQEALPEAVQVVLDAAPHSDWLRRLATYSSRPDAEAMTPLMQAVLHDDPDSMALVVPGSDPMQLSPDGRSAWSMALDRTATSLRIIDAMALQVPQEEGLRALQRFGAENLPRFHQAYEARLLRATLDRETPAPTAPTGARPRL